MVDSISSLTEGEGGQAIKSRSGHLRCKKKRYASGACIQLPIPENTRGYQKRSTSRGTRRPPLPNSASIRFSNRECAQQAPLPLRLTQEQFEISRCDWFIRRVANVLAVCWLPATGRYACVERPATDRWPHLRVYETLRTGAEQATRVGCC